MATERAGLVGELEVLEEEYEALVARIERAKRTGTANRAALQGMLRESRALAEKLEKLRGRVRGVDGRIGASRGQLVGRINERMKALETELPRARPAQRAEIVAELNRLRSERQSYGAPLPPVPSRSAIRRTVQAAEQARTDSPEELLAAADELQDTEDQLRARMQAIKKRIEDLRTTQLLVRRAKSFAAEERFFEETDRQQPRRLAQGDAPEDRGPQSRPTRGGGAAEEAPLTGSPTAEPGTAPAEAPAMSPQSRDEYAEAAPDSNAGGEFGDSGGAPPVLQPSAPAPQEPGGGGGAGGDPFGSTGSGAVLLESQIDRSPDAGRPASALNDRQVDQRLKALQDEQRRLERQATSLRQKASTLREKARRSLR